MSVYHVRQYVSFLRMANALTTERQYVSKSFMSMNRTLCTLGRMTTESTRTVLDHSLLHLLAPLTHLLASHCSLGSRAPLHSFVCSLTHSVAHGKEVFVYGMTAPISHSFNPLCVDFIQFQPTALCVCISHSFLSLANFVCGDLRQS